MPPRVAASACKAFHKRGASRPVGVTCAKRSARTMSLLVSHHDRFRYTELAPSSFSEESFVDYRKEFEQCIGTYVKVVRFSEPTNPDGFIVLYLRPGGRFLFIGYWEGYERSVAAGHWLKRDSEYHLQGYGRVESDAPPDHEGRFARILKLEVVNHTPTLIATEELQGWCPASGGNGESVRPLR
jgi:hypothetical protein